MTTAELLNTYRATVMEIEELEIQLEKAAPSGRPAGYRGIQLDGARSGTNDPMAAALQLSDGLEAMIREKRSDLAQLNPQVYEAITAIRNCRLLMIVQHYYLQARTDEQIARMLDLSTTRVNQLRNKYVRSLDF